MTAPVTPSTPQDASAAPQGANLDRALIHGLAWTGAVRWGAQILSWGATVVVARLLTPTDYGLVGMAMVYLGFVTLVSEFGLGSAIVQQRDLNENQIAQLGGLSMLLAIFLFSVSAVLANPVAQFFGETAVRNIVLVLSISFVLTGFQVLPRALLARDLQFRALAWIEGWVAVLAAVVTLSLAALGFGYWALVLGPLAGQLFATALLLRSRPHRLAWPRHLRQIAGAVSFGWHIVASRVAWYAYSNADFAIVGRVLGKDALGAYTLGWTIATIPVERIGGLLGSVTPGVFSSAQNDRAALNRFLRRLTEGLALITFPASAGIALVADEAVVGLLGERWRPAIVPLRLLAAYAGVRSIAAVFAHMVIATGHAKRNMEFSLVAAVILPASFYVGTFWGTAGVAVAWIVAYPLVLVPFLGRLTFQITSMTVRSYTQTLWPAIGATLAMAGAVLAARQVTPDSWPMIVRLAFHVSVGAGTYGLVAFSVLRDRTRACVALLRSATT